MPGLFRRSFLILFFGVAWALSALTGPAGAHTPILTIATPQATRSFTLEDLRALPVVEFSTTTIWTDGAITFTGVPMRALLDTVQGAGAATRVRAVALNDYSVEIPLAALGEDYPIVAYLMDGAPFSPRNKGPLWIVYPYDADTAYRSDDVYAYSVWQLSRLILSP